MDQETKPSPPSRASTRSSKASLSLDLSNIPPLVQPTPPSNTLIITNLNSLDIFAPDNLQTIREAVSNIAPIHAWSPLKSLKRIIISFFDEESAIKVRQYFDGQSILDDSCRVYFGQPTPITASQDVHLALPDAGKLFFISPPPSPPHGWEMKMEDAPNKMVHADDLADALAKLRHHAGPNPGNYSPISPADSNTAGVFGSRQRSRSSTLIFQPQPPVEGGESPNLPCVTVDDMTDEPADISPVFASMESKPIMAHTSRPPVELMHHA